MKTFVKFCGITDATALADAPEEDGAIGLVIGVPGSPRNLPIPRATEIAAEVPSRLEIWGVMVDPTLDAIREAFEGIGVDWIQVHGRIPEGLDRIEYHRIVPSVPVPPGGAEVEPPTPPEDAEFRRVHLDVAGGSMPGGTGATPSWPACARLVDALPGRKVVLGGGLTPENVGEAIAHVHPWGVDVSSGIESSPGRKDPDRMRRFRAAVRAADGGGHA